MNTKEYTKLAMRTATGKGRSLLNVGLGLPGEAGEVADMIKKHTFQGHELNEEKLILELGDVLWYVALACNLLNVEMEDVMEKNIEKLKKRYPQGFTPSASVNRNE